MTNYNLQCENGNVKSHVVVALIQLSGFITQTINFRLFYRMTEQIGRLVNRDKECIITLSEDNKFAFQLADPYWNRLLYKRYTYEPEIAAVLQLIKHIDFTFLDLGANYGYWSVMVSSEIFGSHDAIAVEPVRDNFNMLSQNGSLNNGRFRIRKEAITEKSGNKIAIRTNVSSISNVGASVVPSQEDKLSDNTETVPSISIDDLCAEEPCAGKPLVIKLSE